MSAIRTEDYISPGRSDEDMRDRERSVIQDDKMAECSREGISQGAMAQIFQKKDKNS